MLGFFQKDKQDQLAEPALEETTPQPRPLIGLALGGGAARGWAHIGVIKALIENGFEPDIIAGTSIGAIAGGCYLSGNLDDLQGFALDLTTRRILSMLDLKFGGSGLIAGSKLTKRLQHYLGNMQIEDLDRPFTAVATELGTGHEIWLSKGNLVNALRASYALPGIFEPVQLGNRTLFDGALVNPVPVSVCRAHGARIVIAVNLSSDIFGRGTVVYHSGSSEHDPERDERAPTWPYSPQAAKHLLRRSLVGHRAGPPGITGVMTDAFNVMQDRISRSRLAGDPPDIMINPRLGAIGLFEFDKAEMAIQLGREATYKVIGEIADTITALS